MRILTRGSSVSHLSALSVNARIFTKNISKIPKLKPRKQKSMSNRKKSGTAKDNGLIMSALDTATNKLKQVICGNVVSRTFSSAQKAEEIKKHSFLSGCLDKFGISALFLSIKTTFARQVESSHIVGLYRRFINALLCSRIRDLGIFFLLFSLFSVASAALEILGTGFIPDTSSSDIICIAATFAASVILLSSKKSVSQKIEESRILSGIFISLLGINPLTFVSKRTPRTHSALALVFGTVFGILTFMFSPLSLFRFMAICCLSMVLLYSPESAALLSIILIPLVDYGTLKLFIAFAALSYFLKLMRGKRNINFSLTDVSVAFAVVALMFAMGISYADLLITGFVFYLIIVNLFKNAELINRGIYCFGVGLCINSFVSAIISVLNMFSVDAGDYISLSSLPINNSALFSIVCIPVAFYMLYHSKTRLTSVVFLLFLISSAINALMSLSLTLWIAYAAVLVIFMAVWSAKPLHTLFFSLLTMPFVYVFMAKFAIVNGYSEFFIPDVFKFEIASVTLFGGGSCEASDSWLTAITSRGGIVTLIIAGIAVLFLAVVLHTAIRNSRKKSVSLICGTLGVIVFAQLLVMALPQTFGQTSLFAATVVVAGIISSAGNVFHKHQAQEDI